MDRPRPAGVTGPTPAQVMGGEEIGNPSLYWLHVGGGLVEVPMDIGSVILHGSRMSVLHTTGSTGRCRSSNFLYGNLYCQ